MPDILQSHRINTSKPALAGALVIGVGATPIIGGGANRILYQTALGTVGESINLQFDETTNRINIGNVTAANALARFNFKMPGATVLDRGFSIWNSGETVQLHRFLGNGEFYVTTADGVNGGLYVTSAVSQSSIGMSAGGTTSLIEMTDSTGAINTRLRATDQFSQISYFDLGLGVHHTANTSNSPHVFCIGNGTAPTVATATSVIQYSQASGSETSAPHFLLGSNVHLRLLQNTGGALTAGAAYTANEQLMIQRMWDAMRSMNLLT